MAAATTGIFVVDDHAVVREGVRLICEETPDLEYVGGAADVDEALPLIRRLRPGVVLVDLHLPRRPGTDLIRELASDADPPRMLVLTSDAGDEVVSEALRAGAVGHVTKDLDPEAIVRAARLAAEASPEALRSASSRSPARSYDVRLSPRERQVLELVVRGHSNQKIGETLGIGERTVASHLASIYRKLQVPNRVLAAQHALRMGLIDEARGGDG